MGGSKRIVHGTIGMIALDCQALIAEEEGQVLLVYTATPGTQDYERLRLLSVVGAQEFESSVEARPGVASASSKGGAEAPRAANDLRQME